MEVFGVKRPHNWGKGVKRPKVINDWNKLSQKIVINPETDCWEWQGFLQPNGYVYVCINYKKTYLHRYSYTVHNGEIPAGMSVLHRCDNRKCVNPNHLFLGTQLDNMRDMHAKGRGLIGDKNPSRKNPERVQGEKNPMAKLTNEIVLKIYAMLKSGVSVGLLSKRYGVARSTLYDIKSGRIWKSVTQKYRQSCEGD